MNKFTVQSEEKKPVSYTKQPRTNKCVETEGYLQSLEKCDHVVSVIAVSPKDQIIRNFEKATRHYLRGKVVLCRCTKDSCQKGLILDALTTRFRVLKNE